MKYAFWPGCVARGAAPELYKSTLAVAKHIGIELDELEAANKGTKSVAALLHVRGGQERDKDR